METKMKGLRDVDERFIIDTDKRIRAYRAKQWERLEGFDPAQKARFIISLGYLIASLIMLMGTIIFKQWTS